MAVALRKSSGVPSTGSIAPVGIRVSSTGVYLEAARVSSWSRIDESVSPPRLVRQVQRRGLVGRRRVVDLQRVVGGDGEGDGGREGAGVALLAVLARVGHLDRGPLGRVDRLGLPDDAVEALDAPVQGVGRVVDRQRIRLAVERELPLGDPVGHPAHRGAEVGVLAQVAVERVEPERHVGDLPVPVRGLDRDDGRAVGGHLHGDLAVPERVEVDGLAVLRLAEAHLAQPLDVAEGRWRGDDRQRKETTQKRGGGSARAGSERVHVHPRHPREREAYDRERGPRDPPRVGTRRPRVGMIPS